MTGWINKIVKIWVKFPNENGTKNLTFTCKVLKKDDYGIEFIDKFGQEYFFSNDNINQIKELTPKEIEEGHCNFP